MATTTLLTPTAPGLLTWEDYLTEGEVNRRYHIIEGKRIFMSAPKLRHQRVQGNTYDILRGYERRTQRGIVVPAPFDVLIRRFPRLKVRQPDVLFVLNTTLARSGGFPEIGVLTVAPELIVEIISDNERERDLDGKLADYAEIGVAEAWVVRPNTQTVEVRQQTGGAWSILADYAMGEAVQSVLFPDLDAPVADFFLP